jgi:hypothetical protein
MRKYISAFLSFTPFLVFIGLFVFFALVFGDPFGYRKERAGPEWERRNYLLRFYLQALEPGDSALYKNGVKKRDSVQELLSYQDRLNYFKENYFSNVSRHAPYYLYESQECFRCTDITPDNSYLQREAARATYYYIGLKGFKLKLHRHYFRDNNTNYIITESDRYGNSTFSDTPPNEVNDDPLLKKSRFYSYIDKEAMKNIHSVPFRYDYWNQLVLIPVSKKTYSTLTSIEWIIGIIFWIYTLLLLFFVPYRILRNISLGKAFDIATIKRVDFLAYNFLLYPFALFIYRSIIHLFVKNYITRDLQSTALVELLGNGLIIYIGLLLFALGVALKKGYKIQQEQELTV